MRSAIVGNGVVTNIIVGEVDGSVPCSPEVGIGWSYDGETFSAPTTPVHGPEALPPLTARQLRLGLIAAGISLASVEGAIEAISDPSDREIAQVEWEYASQFERSHPLIEQVGAALGLSDEQIDAMWLSAGSL